MATVYDAVDTRSGRAAAVKIIGGDQLTEAGRSRFEREARAMLSVHHPNVCAAYDFGELDDGLLYLAMERLHGEDLRARFQREGRLPVATAVRIVRDAAAGLAAAHRRGLIHRDVKPSNIFLVRTSPNSPPNVKVVDFGLAIFSHGGDGAKVTRTGEIVGTPGYMAPEQTRGDRREDGRTDIFSLGVCLYTAITGVSPFGSDAAIAIVVRMLTVDPEPVRNLCPELPIELCDLIMRAMARDPEIRHESMTAFVAALDELIPSLSDKVPSIWLADTDEVRYEYNALEDEQRVVTAMVANGVRNVPEVVGVIRRYGGTPTELSTDQVVGLFGAESLQGDEADRAVRAALALESNCRVIGIGTGRAQQGHGHFSGQALMGAESVTAALPSGVLLDDHTRQRIGQKYVTEGSRVIRLADAMPQAQRLDLVGRDAELSDIGGRMRRAFDEEEPAGVLLLGAPGVGKTRLCQELVASIRFEDATVLTFEGRGESNRRYSSWHAVAVALRELAGLTEDSPPERCIEVMRELAAEAGAEDPCGYFLAAAMGAELPAGISDAIDTARSEPKVMRYQVVNALGDFLEACTAESSVLFVIEDVQWADSASLELAEILSNRMQRAPFFVLMTGRPHAITERAELFESPILEQRHIKELSRKAAGTLANKALGGLSAEITDTIVDVIAEHSAGNPFFIIEIVDHISEKLIAHGADGFDRDAFTLPLTVEAAVQSRLDHLPATDKDLLKRASVFGERFWREALEAQGGPEIGDALARLWRGGLVLKLARRDVRLAGFEEYAFKHRVVREVAHGMLTRAQRRALHEAAGRWLAAIPQAPIAEAAGHLSEGGNARAAAPLWAGAAEQARRDGDLSGVLKNLDRALQGTEDPEEAARLRLLRITAAVESGHYDIAEAELRDLEPQRPLTDVGMEAQALFWQGRVERVHKGSGSGQNHRAAHALFGHAAELYEQVGDMPGLARTLASMGISESYGGLGTGRELAERAVAVAGENRRARAQALASLSLLLTNAGLLSDARAAAERALDDAVSAGDLALEVSVRGDLAYLHVQLGSYAAAADALREVIEQAKRVGDLRSQGYAWHNLGLALLRCGHLEQALDAEDKALDMAAEGGNTRLAAYCQLYRALILLETGELDRAFKAGQSALISNACTAEEPSVRTALAMIHHAAGRIQDGLEEADRAASLREDAGGRMQELEAELFWVRSALLYDSGLNDEGDAVLQSARTIILEAADTAAGGKQARRQFLWGIPVHRWILELTGDRG